MRVASQGIQAPSELRNNDDVNREQDHAPILGERLYATPVLVSDANGLASIAKPVAIIQMIKEANANSVLNAVDPSETTLSTSGVTVTTTPAERLFGGWIEGTDTGNAGQNSNVRLFDTGGSSGVLSFVDASGNVQVWLTQNGKVTEQLQPGDNIDLGDGRKLVYSQDGNVVLSGLEYEDGTATVSISADLEQATVISYPDNFNPFIRIAPWAQGVEQTTYDLDTGEVSALPIKLTGQAAYDHYAATPEGQAILQAEGSSSYSGSLELRNLFVARVRFDRGEGGPELFHEFNVDRAELSGSELLAYDAQVDKILHSATFISHTAADGLQPMSGSMRYLIASGMVETMGTNPDVIDSALAELTGGFMVSLDGSFIDAASSPTAGGVFMHSGTTPTGDPDVGLSDGLPKVLFRASSLMFSRADATDTYSIIAHEVAHVLDVDRTTSGWYDSVLVGMSPEQAAAVTRIAEEMLAANAADPTNNFGLSDYMFSRGKVEFISEATEFFLSGEEGAYLVFTASPELYAILNEYYDAGYPAEPLQPGLVSAK